MNARVFKNYLLGIACLISTTVCCPLFSEIREFQTITSVRKDRKVEYLTHTVKGTERMNPALNRLSMLSENQLDYPTPETGCGPTALLNILIWYEKFGLIRPLYRDANPRKYKLKLFKEIDRHLARQSENKRTDEIGTRGLDIAIVMDRIVKEHTEGKVRIHTDIVEAPLTLANCLETTKNFRSGFLMVNPKDLISGELLGGHAAVIIRTDRAGYVTLATWGQLYHGLLKERNGEQWFIPQNPKHMELKISWLMRFVPYIPDGNR